MQINQCALIVYVIFLLLQIDVKEAKRWSGFSRKSKPPKQQSYPRPSAPQQPAPPPYGWNVPSGNKPPPYPGSNPYGTNVGHQPNYGSQGIGSNRQPAYGNAPPAYGSPGFHNSYSPGGTHLGGGSPHYNYQPNPQYSGFYKANKPKYSIGSHLGAGAVGAFLGYSVARLSTPSYTHSRYYDESGPMYDRYQFYHYDHDRDQVDRQTLSNLDASNLMLCEGDSSILCPLGLKVMCLTNGVVMCVVHSIEAAPCKDVPNRSCAITAIPCIAGVQCSDALMNTTTLQIPCIATAKVRGSIITVNNTIVRSDAAMNSVAPNNAFMPLIGQNLNETATTTATNATTTTTLSPTNETTVSVATVNPVEPVNLNREKRGNGGYTQDFCVTIMAKPVRSDRVYHQTRYNSGNSNGAQLSLLMIVVGLFHTVLFIENV